MDISINGTIADITLESERTVGEVVSGLETWFQGSGYHLCGLELDGEVIAAGAVPAVFDRNIAGIRHLDIRAESMFQLLEEALEETRRCLEALETASPAEWGDLVKAWEESAAESFLAAEAGELGNAVARTLREHGAVAAARALVEERLRELRDPWREAAALEGIVTEIIKRLEDLPLDIQTGKDNRAAETVTIFSNITEKLFRIFTILKRTGQYRDTSLGETFVDEFDAALKELLAAYETKDTVLVGDLAEYELAPRLGSFYGALIQEGV